MTVQRRLGIAVLVVVIAATAEPTRSHECQPSSRVTSRLARDLTTPQIVEFAALGEYA